jgi:hypothetical protein
MDNGKLAPVDAARDMGHRSNCSGEARTPFLGLPNELDKAAIETAATALPVKIEELTASRLGVLSMILCFALGIANIFTFYVFIIIFSVICL